MRDKTFFLLIGVELLAALVIIQNTESLKKREKWKNVGTVQKSQTMMKFVGNV